MAKKKSDKTEDKNRILQEQLARALADYDNLQKRFDRQKDSMQSLASLGLIVKLLPLLDMLEEAQKHLQDSGLAIAITEFYNILKSENVEKIMLNEGDKFDVEVCEAIETVSGEEGKIAEIVLSGWRFTDSLIIRPAKVKVGKKENTTKTINETNRHE